MALEVESKMPTENGHYEDTNGLSDSFANAESFGGNPDSFGDSFGDNNDSFGVEAAFGFEIDVSGADPIAEPAYSERAKPLYFVRVPRPNVDETKIKTLQQEFYASVEKIKGFNGKLSAKRSVVIQLRKEMADGRSLRDTARPVFEEKLARLKELKDYKSGFITRIGDHRSSIKGLDVKSEEELDARVKELEDKIQHDGVSLREEKLIVVEISKLKAQRSKVKEYGTQKTSMTELESEVSRIKNVINELEGEFKIVKSEKDQASEIIKDLQTKLAVADKDLKDLEEEQGESVKLKNEILEKLQAARTEADESMGDYRTNRTFSRQVRELVETNQVEEASRLCADQADELMGKLSSNSLYRKDYESLWSAQRKYAVSMLLPQSCQAVLEASMIKAKPTGKATAAPLVPRLTAAERAKALIESALKDAGREYADVSMRRAAAEKAAEEVEDAPTPEPAPEAAKAVEAAPKPVVVAVRKLAPKVEVPVAEPPTISAEPFVLPVSFQKAQDDKSAEEQKAKVREEQRAKQQEAEMRKRKKEKRDQEIADKKKLKAQELKKEESKPKAAPVAAPPPPAPVVEEVEEAEVVVVAKPVAKIPKGPPMNPALKPPAMARRAPKGEEKLLNTVPKLLKEHQVSLAVAAVSVLLMGLIIFSVIS